MADAPPRPVNVKVPTTEQGYTNPAAATGGMGSWWSAPEREQTAELRWPQCIDVYDAMRRQDAQVSSVLRAVTSPIQRTPWRLDGDGCDPKVTAHVAADLGLPILGDGNSVPAIRTRGRFSWNTHLRMSLLFLVFGHSIFEQKYRLDANELAHLAKLSYRPPETISKFNVARDGGLISVEQWGTDKPLPVEHLVAYVLDQEGGSWIGQSLLRPAYKNWLIKDRLLRTQAQSVDRNGMGIPKYTGAEGETDLTAGEEIATDVRAGDNSGAAIAYGAKLDLMGVTGTLPDADKPIRYHDEQIARAVLAHFLNLGSQTGSWALGSTFADFFTLSLRAIADEVRSVANAHIIEDLVDINWGPDEPAPRLVFDEIGSNGQDIVQAIATLVNAKVLQPDEDLEQFVRTALGLPARAAVPYLQEVPA